MKQKQAKRKHRRLAPKPDGIAEMAGILKDDPHFAMVLEEIRKQRKQIDGMMRRSAK